MCRMAEDKAEAIIKSRKVFNGIHTVQQAIFALFDLELHGERAAEIADGRLTSTQLFGEIHRQALPQLAGAIDANYAYHHRLANF
jgi:Zn-dependent oligopeptidase